MSGHHPWPPPKKPTAAPVLSWWRRKLIFWLLPEGYQLIRRETWAEQKARVGL